MTPEDIKTIAHLLAGTEPGWQTRFADMIQVSRGYGGRLLNGSRPLTQVVIVRIIEAARARAIDYRARASQLDGILAILMPAPGEPLPPGRDEDDDPEGHAALDALFAEHFDEGEK